MFYSLFVLNCVSSLPNDLMSQSSQRDDEVVFHVGQETVMRISARKSILSRNNEVFHAMFCGPYTLARENLRCRQPKTVDSNVSPESKPIPVDYICDPDVDGRAFKNLIRY